MKPVDFGFQTVSPEEKTKRVQSLFSSVSSRYNLMNDVMSLGLHRSWKNYFVRMISPPPGGKILDVGGGTGDIAYLLHQYYPDRSLSIIPFDLTYKMLNEGRKKSLDKGLLLNQWCCGNGETLPFPDEIFDCYTISFGLRNITHREKALKEAKRVLKKEGWFYCLEFSKLSHPFFKKLYHLYSFQLIPFLGEHIAKDKEAYQYLVESIERFPNQVALREEITEAGLQEVSYENIFNGVVAIHKGRKIK